MPPCCFVFLSRDEGSKGELARSALLQKSSGDPRIGVLSVYNMALCQNRSFWHFAYCKLCGNTTKHVTQATQVNR
jgi:hypothetical protein